MREERTERMTVRLTPAEQEWIVKMAEKAGVSKSRYMRKVVLGELAPAEVPHKKIHREMKFKNGITQAKMKKIFLGDMPKLGNNLNQIARRLNEGQPADDDMVEQMKYVREELNEIGKVIIKALR